MLSLRRRRRTLYSALLYRFLPRVGQGIPSDIVQRLLLLSSDPSSAVTEKGETALWQEKLLFLILTER